jgi:UDP-N-acetylglucosamine 2-epimerase (non-hydrolysing)
MTDLTRSSEVSVLRANYLGGNARIMLPAFGEISRHLPLVLPAHLRSAWRLKEAGLPDTVHVIPPAGHLGLHCARASARLVLTDSGGVQEETTVLGVPWLTLRDNTERPITITGGTNRLVGRHPDRIVRATCEVLDAPAPAPRTQSLWDGKAGQRIAAILVEGQDGRDQVSRNLSY